MPHFLFCKFVLCPKPSFLLSPIPFISLQRAFLALQEKGRAEIEAQSDGKRGGKGAGPKAAADMKQPITSPSAGAKLAVGFNTSASDDGRASNAPHNSIQSLIQYRDQRLVMDRDNESFSETLMINRSVRDNSAYTSMHFWAVPK